MISIKELINSCISIDLDCKVELVMDRDLSVVLLEDIPKNYILDYFDIHKFKDGYITEMSIYLNPVSRVDYNNRYTNKGRA